MDGNWQINDLALCIKRGLWRDARTMEYVEYGPKAGEILTVRRIGRKLPVDGENPTLLGFSGWGADLFSAAKFVKLDHPAAETKVNRTAASVREYEPA